MQAKINPAFWSDDDILDCDTSMKLAALWALSNPRVDGLGMTAVSRKMFEFETGSPFEVLERTLQALPKFMSIHGNILWVHNYVRYQLGSGRKLIANNCFRALRERLQALPNEDLRRSFIGAYPEFAINTPHSPPKRSVRTSTLPLPPEVVREGEGEGVLSGESPERGEIPSPEEWMAGCAMAGLPASYAESEWHRLGETGFQVRNGCYLTRANMHHAIARRVGWWRENRSRQHPAGRIDREQLRDELEALRSAGDPATLDRRKEIVRLLGGDE